MSRQINAAQKLALKAKQAAVYGKAKSPLRGFEFVENVRDAPVKDIGSRPVNQKIKGQVPNQKFQHEENLDTYRSYQNYVTEATKARWRLNADKKEGWWLKLSDLNEKFYLPAGINEHFEGNALIHQKNLGQKYRATKLTRKMILKDLKSQKPLTTSPINCLIDLDELNNTDFTITDGQNLEKSVSKKSELNPDLLLSGEFYTEQIVKILAHYGIFQDLKIERFTPQENFLLSFGENSHVLFGNEISPSEMLNSQPTFEFEDSAEKYTSVIVSLDSGVDDTQIYLHYLNHQGTEKIKFLEAFPFRGTGYHRMICLVFKNLEQAAFSQAFENLTDKSHTMSLKEREVDIFRDQDSIKDLENCLVGVKMFVTRWDKSVTEICHEKLRIKGVGSKFGKKNSKNQARWG